MKKPESTRCHYCCYRYLSGPEITFDHMTPKRGRHEPALQHRVRLPAMQPLQGAHPLRHIPDPNLAGAHRSGAFSRSPISREIWTPDPQSHRLGARPACMQGASRVGRQWTGLRATGVQNRHKLL